MSRSISRTTSRSARSKNNIGTSNRRFSVAMDLTSLNQVFGFDKKIWFEYAGVVMTCVALNIGFGGLLSLLNYEADPYRYFMPLGLHEDDFPITFFTFVSTLGYFVYNAILFYATGGKEGLRCVVYSLITPVTVLFTFLAIMHAAVPQTFDTTTNSRIFSTYISLSFFISVMVFAYYFMPRKAHNRRVLWMLNMIRLDTVDFITSNLLALAVIQGIEAAGNVPLLPVVIQILLSLFRVGVMGLQRTFVGNMIVGLRDELGYDATRLYHFTLYTVMAYITFFSRLAILSIPSVENTVLTVLVVTAYRSISRIYSRDFLRTVREKLGVTDDLSESVRDELYEDVLKADTLLSYTSTIAVAITAIFFVRWCPSWNLAQICSVNNPTVVLVANMFIQLAGEMIVDAVAFRFATANISLFNSFEKEKVLFAVALTIISAINLMLVPLVGQSTIRPPSGELIANILPAVGVVVRIVLLITLEIKNRWFSSRADANNDMEATVSRGGHR